MVTATWALFGVTALLVFATWWYALHTRRIAQKTADAAESARQSAAAAERSARAAEEMAEVERERQREPDRPQIDIRYAAVDRSPSDPSLRLARFWVENTGPGCAYEVAFFCRVERNGTLWESKVEEPPPAYMEPSPKHPSPAAISHPDVSDALRLICVCHYTDTHATSAEPRVYHSVFDATEGSTGPSRYYRPDHPLDTAYAGVCNACQASASG
jgi:hypothetical protein